MLTSIENHPANHLYIVAPSYDPMIEYYTQGAFAFAVRRAQCHPGRPTVIDGAGLPTKLYDAPGQWLARPFEKPRESAR
jgi:hypothetical protein